MMKVIVQDMIYEKYSHSGEWNWGKGKIAKIQNKRIPQTPRIEMIIGATEEPRPLKPPVDTSIRPQMK